MSGKKSNLPDGRIPDRLPDGRPAVAWRSRWTEGTLPLWLVATAGGMAVLFVVGLFFYGSTPVSVPPDQGDQSPRRRRPSGNPGGFFVSSGLRPETSRTAAHATIHTLKYPRYQAAKRSTPSSIGVEGLKPTQASRAAVLAAVATTSPGCMGWKSLTAS